MKRFSKEQVDRLNMLSYKYLSQGEDVFALASQYLQQKKADFL